MKQFAFLLSATVLALCSAAATKKGTVDCSQFQQSATVPGSTFQVRFTSILDNHVGPNGYLHAEVTYEGLGWIGLGYSVNGRMVPGYAIVGLPGMPNSASNPGKYAMMQFGMCTLMDPSVQTLRNASVSSNSTHTMMTFTKRLHDTGDLNINGAGSNNFMVAFGPSTNFVSYHTYRSSFAFSLQSCVNGAVATASSSSGGSLVLVGPSTEQQLWTAHGVFAAVAWGVLAPIAIAASILRRIFINSDLPALWFKVHLIVNMSVLIFTAVSFAFAVRATELQQKEHFKVVKHRTTGLVIMILVCVQVLMGLLRPHLPHAKEPEEDNLERDGEAAEDCAEKEQPTPKKSLKRLAFEILHRLLGFTLLGFAWWQVANGLGLYSLYFSEKNLSNIFWVIVGALSAITVFLYAVLSFDCI